MSQSRVGADRFEGSSEASVGASVGAGAVAEAGAGAPPLRAQMFSRLMSQRDENSNSNAEATGGAGGKKLMLWEVIMQTQPHLDEMSAKELAARYAAAV
jgi:hypothetical protein